MTKVKPFGLVGTIKHINRGYEDAPTSWNYDPKTQVTDLLGQIPQMATSPTTYSTVASSTHGGLDTQQDQNWTDDKGRD